MALTNEEDIAIMKVVGERLKEIRNKLNLSQHKFSKRLGINKTTTALLETAKQKFTLRLLIKIAKEFDVSLDWLLMGKGVVVISDKYIGIDFPSKEITEEVNKLLSELVQSEGKFEWRVVFDALKYYYENTSPPGKD